MVIDRLIAGFSRLRRWIAPPDRYRPERHYMRGDGPKSRAVQDETSSGHIDATMIDKADAVKGRTT
jgi:hypothetical protein